MTRPWLPPDPAFPGIIPPLDPHGGTRPGEPVPVTSPMVDLSSNVLPYGPDPEILNAVRAAPLDRYPDPLAMEARGALAAHWGIPVERLLLTPGASELIFRIALAYLAPGDGALVVGSTFGEYRRATLLRGGWVDEVGRGRPHLPPVNQVAAHLQRMVEERRTLRLVFLCTPNNPTGDAWSSEEVRSLADHLPTGTLLVLDESYRSIAEGGLAPPYAPGSPRILHVRSLTKDLSLPGLRVAAAVGPPEIVDVLQRVAPPWVVSTGAQAAVRAAVRADVLRRLEHRIQQTLSARDRLDRALRTRGFRTVPSVVGHILWSPCASSSHTSPTAQWSEPDPIETPSDLTAQARTAMTWAEALERHGIRVRRAESFGLPGWLRVGVGTPAENRRFLAALAEIRMEENS